MISKIITVSFKEIPDMSLVYDQGLDKQDSLDYSIANFLELCKPPLIISSVKINEAKNSSFHDHCEEFIEEIKTSPVVRLFLGYNPNTRHWCLIDNITLDFFPEIYLGYELVKSFYYDGYLFKTFKIIIDELSQNHYDINRLGDLLISFKNEEEIFIYKETITKYQGTIPNILEITVLRTEEILEIVFNGSGTIKLKDFILICCSEETGPTRMLCLLLDIVRYSSEKNILVEELNQMELSYYFLKRIADEFEGFIFTEDDPILIWDSLVTLTR